MQDWALQELSNFVPEMEVQKLTLGRHNQLNHGILLSHTQWEQMNAQPAQVAGYSQTSTRPQQQSRSTDEAKLRCFNCQELGHQATYCTMGNFDKGKA